MGSTPARSNTGFGSTTARSPTRARSPGRARSPTEGTVPFAGLPADGKVSVPAPSPPSPFSRPSPYSGVYSFQVRAGAVGTGPGLILGSTCPPHRLFATPVPADPPLRRWRPCPPTVRPGPTSCTSSSVPRLSRPPRLPGPFPGRSRPRSRRLMLSPRLSSGPVRVRLQSSPRPRFPVSGRFPVPRDVVRVNVAPGYSGTLEYRVWTHTGYQPSREDERFVLPGEDDDRWRPAASGNFLVSGLDYPLFWSSRSGRWAWTASRASPRTRCR